VDPLWFSLIGSVITILVGSASSRLRGSNASAAVANASAAVATAD
jgi:hypothetical protein